MAFVRLIVILFLSTFVHVYTAENMVKPTNEIRAYIESILATKDILNQLGAVFKGEYAFTDYIYKRQNTDIDLDKEYMRLRVYEKTNWDQKKYLLVHKTVSVGFTGVLPLKNYFDSLDQAEQELCDYVLVCSFCRTGWEYELGDSRIFVEDIQYLSPTIEVVAPGKKSIDYLFSKLSIDHAIEHSVPYLVQQQAID